MKKYILHRLLYLIPILLGITLFTFILLLKHKFAKI